jgi:predicted enzyme related to lactoylglutathione lyase
MESISIQRRIPDGEWNVAFAPPTPASPNQECLHQFQECCRLSGSQKSLSEGAPMIQAVHAIIYSRQSDAVRAFFRDVLELPSVDAGRGWLIFALPPAELAVHPTEGRAQHQLYLMCDDIQATMAELQTKGVEFTQPVKDAGWGLLTALRLPDGEELYLYQPRHASPIPGISPQPG